MWRDGGDAERVLVAATRIGGLARRLQDEGARGFVDSWKDLLGAIETKRKATVQPLRRVQ
jgi:transaldolase